MTALLVIAILVLLIVVHELGHFIAAKLSGVRVTEFGVGYPPRALTFGIFGGTEYTLNWVPFGGFVRLFGDEGKNEHGRGSLMDAPRWKQAVILVAGVCMNALAAWALFAGAYHAGFPQVVATREGDEPIQLIVSDVVAGSPAYAAGIAPGDTIIDMTDSKGMRAIDGLTPESVTAFVREHPGKEIYVTFNHKGVKETATVIPAQGVLEKAAGQPALGVALALVANRSVPWSDAIVLSARHTLYSFSMVGGDLWGLVSNAAKGEPSLSGVVGPIGIVGYVGEAAQSGYGAVLMLAALISVNLAIINLIPIPALDGGRLLVLAIETLTRRRAPKLAVQSLNALGVFLIIVVMITVTYNDIARLFA